MVVIFLPDSVFLCAFSKGSKHLLGVGMVAIDIVVIRYLSFFLGGGGLSKYNFDVFFQA
jgi:hypothetical protein